MKLAVETAVVEGKELKDTRGTLDSIIGDWDGCRVGYG
jgi:hypothetical protein